MFCADDRMGSRRPRRATCVNGDQVRGRPALGSRAWRDGPSTGCPPGSGARGGRLDPAGALVRVSASRARARDHGGYDCRRGCWEGDPC
jgi:hypothetical protein